MTPTTTPPAPAAEPTDVIAPLGIDAHDWWTALGQLGWTPPGRAPAATTRSVTVTASDETGPTEARCHTCAATWTRPADGGGLAAWLRTHPCTPEIPPALDALDRRDAALIAAGLLGISLGLVARAVTAARTHNELAGTNHEQAFWRAAGRQDGLIEAERYLLGVIEALDQRGDGPR